MMNKHGIILAAGKGSRMPNREIPKSMYLLKNKPMLEYLINSFKKAGINKPIIVVGYKKELIQEYFKDQVDYVEQKELLGTGHAVMATEEKLGDESGSVLIAYGDMPLWSIQTIKALFKKKEETNAKLALATVDLPDSFAYGRIIRDTRGRLLANVEEKDCTKKQLKIKEKNPGLYLPNIQWLFKSLKKIKTNNAQQEYYLPDIIEIAVKEQIPIATIKISDASEAIGVNTGEDYKAIQKQV